MKKKIAIIILGLTVALSVMACGNKDNLTETTEGNSTITTEKMIAEETNETEMVVVESIETGDETHWGEVGIKDGIATVYDGAELRVTENETSKYEFFKPADFLQFATMEISYGDANFKFWVGEDDNWSSICNIASSGNYELREGIDNGADEAEIYVNGDCIGVISVGGMSPAHDSTRTLDECNLSSLEIYPMEGLILNGYEFEDCQMKNVVEHFGNPNTVSYTVNEDGLDEIMYEYKLGISSAEKDEISGEFVVVGNDSHYRFYTTDGKNIERIVVKLAFTENTVYISDQSSARYYAGDNIELKQAFLDWDENSEDIYGDIKFKVGEINGDTLRAFISISNLSGVTDKEIDFIVWNNLICYIYDEDYINLDYEITYTSSDNDEYDYTLSFKIKDIEKATYLRFAGHWLDDNSSNKYMYEVMVKLK